MHQTEINTAELIKFIAADYGTHKFESDKCTTLLPYMIEIRLIVAGKRLYNDDNLQKLREYVQFTFLPFPSRSQFVESGVKEAAIVSSTGKEERNRSVVAIL